MKYNYIIVGSDADYHKVSYSELNGRDDAVYLWKPLITDNFFVNSVYRIHTSPHINKYVKVPFQKLWNGLICNVKFSESKPICYLIFAGRKKEIDNGLIEYLRKKDPTCKIVIFYQDMVKRSKLPDVDRLKGNSDLILSFDQSDVEEYGLIYYPLVYSEVDIPEDANIAQSDVYFVGKAKDRLDRIIAAYEKFRNADMKCDFHIIGVDEKDRKYADEIVYQEQMPYMENLQRIHSCKCMLEVMQQGGHGYTLRYCEAIMYDKAIITDNPEVKNAPFFNASLIQHFENPENIEVAFVNNIPEHPDYHFKKNLSPVRLLEFIDSRL